ncbi:MAG: hypothetical protein EPO35_10555 [Acidobacteria bacterium]|nr:MAG: hypothetical protein EPO35_10555 [Acidobacteriota bacterium]
MKKLIVGLTAFAFVGLALAASVTAAAETTVMGKLKDVKCAGDGKVDEAGADSDACATACAKRGETMAVIAKDGMYIITGKFGENKNEKLIAFMGKELAVKGTVTEKDGKKMIDVTSISEAKK